MKIDLLKLISGLVNVSKVKKKNFCGTSMSIQVQTSTNLAENHKLLHELITIVLLGMETGRLLKLTVP